MQRSGSKAGRGASGGRGGRAAANGSAPSEEGKAADTGSNKADAGLLKMNYFAALSGVGDADAHKTALSAEEEQRRRAAAVGNGTAAASSRRSGGKEGTGKATSGLKQPLVWIDLEMTGLDVESDAILQIAVICTDGSLEELIEGPELAIHQPDDVLATMNEWCVEQHGKSGLTQACRDSGTSLAQAEQQVLEFVQQHAPEPDTAQIAGNSVHVDLAFLRKHMPRIVDHLHYRIVDVSTVGELARRWFPKEHARGPRKKNTHTAMSDIRESIEQLIYFRRTIFKRWLGANLP
ncbi:hypothetical protein D9Q98_006560 [Chlorella vulgaris]|uniref:Exonuclease domain-containing protein n=1 Tax=Chlorella vulgaris TaxID=3077 RepID=A0A9D4TKN4_CHLVU|nr:hypothetical protein D9Q98_006560 [Chlorella vulgaris]